MYVNDTIAKKVNRSTVDMFIYELATSFRKQYDFWREFNNYQFK